MKKPTYTVQYSRFVNGTEYPTEVKFKATSEKDAENQLDQEMKKQSEIEYKVKEITKEP